MDPFVYVVALLTVFVVFHYAKRWKFQRAVNRLPGPPYYPIVGNCLDLLVPRKKLMETLQKQYRENKPIYRLWLGATAEIMVTLPEHIEVILGNTKSIEKSTVYYFLRSWLGEGLLTSSGSKWHARRKLITPTFHFKILEVFQDVFWERSEALTEKLLPLVGEKSFDIHPYITRCALDIICETAMGIRINTEEKAGYEYMKAIDEISELTVQRQFRPWLHPDIIFRNCDKGRRYQLCLDVLHRFTDKVIQERKMARTEAIRTESEADYEDQLTGNKRRLAFLDLLLEASENGNKFSDIEIREEVDTFMFEGHDTTTSAICWCLFLLGENEQVQEKAFEEQESIFQGSDRPATMRDLHEMKYLERVIKESLRLYPSVPFIGRKLTEDRQLGEYLVPAGCMINIHIFHVHRDPRFWPDPERFDPDRFLPERATSRHPYAYVPFSAGPRNCIGQKFALQEEKTILSTILRKFRVRSTEKRHELVLLNELILRSSSGFQVQLSLRK